jgi:hypothetical protein
MAKPFKEWTVLPHGPLVRLEENIMTVSGMLNMPPMGEVERRMTVVRLRGERLVIYSAIALDEPQMKVLEAFGKPSFLVVPNDIHRMDARIWKERYPGLEVIAPHAVREKVGKVVRVDESEADFRDPSVHLITVPGTAEREMALVIENAGGTTLVINDLIFNLANRPGVTGWLFKKLGMTGDEPHIPPIVKRRAVDDAAALRAQLEAWSELPSLKRIVVSHGPVIADEPGVTLKRIAQDLAA